jgi:hypothetical protein
MRTTKDVSIMIYDIEGRALLNGSEPDTVSKETPVAPQSIWESVLEIVCAVQKNP